MQNIEQITTNRVFYGKRVVSKCGNTAERMLHVCGTHIQRLMRRVGRTIEASTLLSQADHTGTETTHNSSLVGWFIDHNALVFSLDPLLFERAVT